MQGTYFLKDTATYKAEGQTKSILISKRKHARPGMAASFILLVDANGNRTYCSSLYPTEKPNEYNIEYQGNRYKVIHNETAITIHAA